MHCEAFADIFVKRALTAGIEGTDEHRELVSRLLSLSYGLDVTMRQVSNGFVRLLESIDDLEVSGHVVEACCRGCAGGSNAGCPRLLHHRTTSSAPLPHLPHLPDCPMNPSLSLPPPLPPFTTASPSLPPQLDVPAAREHAAKFIARAVADEIVAPAFVSSPFVASLAEDVLAEARAHLSQPHALARLAHCWGVSGAAFPLSDIKASLGTAISEYYAAGGGAAAAEEALRCVAEAGVPHYAHEAVYRALVRALDTWPDAKRADACVQLLLAAAPAAGAAAAAAAPAPSAGGAGAAGSAAGDAASAGSSAAGSSGLPSSPRAKSAISPLQLATGVRRAAGAICDIEKDAPRAREGLTSIVGRLKAGGALAADFELVMPAPGSAVPLPSPSLSVASSTA